MGRGAAALLATLLLAAGVAAQARPRSRGRPPSGSRTGSSTRRAPCCWTSRAPPLAWLSAPAGASGARLERGLRRDAPESLRRARSALDDAAAAARRGDQVALAAARGRLRAALLRGSYGVTVAAVRADDTRRAGPGCSSATSARQPASPAPAWTRPWPLRRLERRRTSPRAALLSVRKDLLDAYQARLADQLDVATDAAERRFRGRWAQTAALTAGLWPILAPEYERARGRAPAPRPTPASGRSSVPLGAATGARSTPSAPPLGARWTASPPRRSRAPSRRGARPSSPASSTWSRSSTATGPTTTA